MSIEAIRELGTLASVCPELNMANYTEDDVRHLNDWAIEMSLLVEKFAAIQQAESEPVAFIQHLRDHETGAEETELVWERDEDLDGPLYWYTPLYTLPAPGVPDDVARDAERWRTFLATRPSNTHEGIIAAIDAAMLAAKREN